MQSAMSVSVLLLLTACVSRFVHVSPRGIWAVITLGLKIGNSILITCGLLHVYEQTASVINC